MLFPLRDSIPARRYPVVNTALIVVCALVFAYQLLLGSGVERLMQVAAFIPARLFNSVPPWSLPGPEYGLVGNLVTILLSMFMHGGWLHVIGNMWFLYIFGDNVEDALGHLGYLFFYLGGGVVATLAHAFTDPSSVMPLVGASGAIAAVLGAYIVWYPRSRVRTLVFLGFFITMAELPAVVFLGFWLVLQVFLGTLAIAAAPGAGGVAWFAHVGGFLFGVAVALLARGSGMVTPAAPSYQVWYRG